MLGKKLAVWGLIVCLVTIFAGGAAFADELADVQQRIKDKALKWVAKPHANPEQKGLGLLKDGFAGNVPPAVRESEKLLGLAPASLDWRNIGADNGLGVLPGNYVSSVKNQGSCGSCWAFATTAAAEATTQIALNEPIDPLVSGSAYNLSEQIMLTCSGAGSCNGGYVTSASSYVANTGLLREEPAGCYAYSPSSTTCPNPTAYPGCDQTRYRIDSWSGVSAGVDAMKNALNTYGPLVATYAVYNDFYRYYRSGVYEATSCDAAVNPLVGYHAVSVVGYQDADATHPVGYFIVKNSWGTGWGESGYFRIGYSQLGNCVRFGGSTLAYAKTSCSGAVTVTSPGSSEVLQAGTGYPITWSAAGSIGPYVKIDLYQAGKLVRTIKANAPAADESYQWTVDSDLQGTGYALMITSTTCSSAYGTSGEFSINPAAAFEVSGVVTSSGSGLAGVTLTFSRVSGTGAIPAAVVTDGNGGWQQTGFQEGTVYRATPSQTNCSFSPTSRDFTSASNSLDFTVIENKIDAVTSPAGGAVWKAGASQVITWTYTGNPGTTVQIILINGTTGGSTTLTSKAKIGSGGTGSYTWRISKQQAAGSNYRIRVTSTGNGSSATSPGFTITK